MEVEKLARELVRNMGLVKTNGQEKWLTPGLGEKRSRLLNCFQVRQTAAWLLRHLDRTEKVGVEATVAVWTDCSIFPLLRGWVVRRQAPAVRLVVTVVACYARVEHLAHPGRQVALLPEVLWKGGEVAGMRPPVGVEVIEPGGVWTSGCEEGGSAGSTHGLLSVGPGENGTLAGQKVEVWGEGCLVAITSQAWLQVIHYYQQYVWWTRI